MPSEPDPVAPQRLGDLPEPRRTAWLWTHALDLDYDGIEQLVMDRAQTPCRWDGNRGRIDLVGLTAVLGSDGRFHLRSRDGWLVCERGTGPSRRRAPDPQRSIDQESYLVWSTDGTKYSIHPPNCCPWPGATESVTFRWSVRLTETTADPVAVPNRYRCPTQETWTWWPAHHNPKTADGRMRALLARELGPDCHACGYAPGHGIDHDHFTGAVRGLLCRLCNNSTMGVESCPHLSGCRWADYLNDPPAARLKLTYPRRGKPWRTSSHAARVEALGFDPFE
ncbi:endonuclease domain-containing protein [Nocardia concava]|uniref:endonuclease domain-containing protein n=1 Tax=Nocardia concava TaxID=257281 RepID=UPI00030ECB2E|nr:endonuclease domain-containing protein [Nocardia concava]